MPTLSEVADFLTRLHAKMHYYGPDHITFEGYGGQSERAKNRQTLLALLDYGYGARDRVATIFALVPTDYYRGPTPDTNNLPPGEGDLWEFGVWIKPKRGSKKEVYIKVQLGAENSIPICISFHFPDRGRKISYPLQAPSGSK